MTLMKIKKFFSKVKSFYLREDGGKSTIILSRLVFTIIFLFLCIFLPISLISSSSKNNDTSSIKKSSSRLNLQSQPTYFNNEPSDQNDFGGISNTPDKQGIQEVTKAQALKRPRINYNARQVLSLNNQKGGNRLPIGINVIGKLLTSIDSRTKNQIVKVIIPYGGKHKGSGNSLPANTILFGGINYSGKGEKVEINFHKGLLPNGEEFQIQAHALDSKDYSVGISGDVHGSSIGRNAAVLGLTMVGSMTETLVKKEALGQGFKVTPKASLKNGFYNGISDIANMEANRKAKSINNEQNYVLVEAGHDLIISITNNIRSK